MSDALLIVIYIGFNVILNYMQSIFKCPSLGHLTINKVFVDLLHDYTHTVRGCFHLGLCVLLHLSVLFDCPSTATSTYGLGPNQFLLFSLSLAESTTRKINHCKITHNAIFTDLFWQSILQLMLFQMYLTCDLQLGLHGSSITLQALLPHQKDLQQRQIFKSHINMGLPLQGTKKKKSFKTEDCYNRASES